MANVVVQGFGGPGHNQPVVFGYGGPVAVAAAAVSRIVMKLIPLDVISGLVSLPLIMKITELNADVSLKPLSVISKLMGIGEQQLFANTVNSMLMSLNVNSGLSKIPLVFDLGFSAEMTLKFQQVVDRLVSIGEQELNRG